jgi:hypothetical protein
MLNIIYDKAKLKKLERELRRFPKSLPKVMSRGLNRTGSSARTQIARNLSKKTGLKVGEVRSKLHLQKATYSYWQAAVTVSAKRMSLNYLKPRKTAKGLSVKQGKKRVRITKAFEALGGWFIRLPAAGGYKSTIGVAEALEIDAAAKVKRLPVGRIKGPVLSQVFSSAQDEADRIYNESLARLEKNIDDQVKLILSKRIPA